MTKFDPNINSAIGPAMMITDAEDARQFLKDYISYLEEFTDWTIEDGKAIVNGDFTRAEQLAKRNLAYHAGYFDDETRERVERLFDCEHPIFGKFLEMGQPTSDEAVQCGFQRKTLKEIRNQKQ